MTYDAPIKAVLFDLDDTLFDHHFSSRCALEEIQASVPSFATRSLAELENDYLTLLEEVWPAVLRGEITIHESRIRRFRYLLEKYEAQFTDDDCHALVTTYTGIYKHKRQVIPGAVELLESLKPSVKIVVVTNNLIEEQREKVRQCKIDHLIDELICSEEVGVPKPGREIFELALKRANCAPHEAVMMGDSWAADIIGATALGIRSIWINRHGATIPDPSLATEINSLMPTEAITALVLGKVPRLTV